LDDEYAVVVPKFINSILHGQPPPIYGTGRQSRDFTHISNVVEANLRALRRANSGGDIFNIASGQPRSVLELVCILNRIIGRKIRPVFLDVRPGDVFKTHADISKAKKVLGYRPLVDFEKGLESTLADFRKRMRSR
jgi:nucleoside-diphosphate-sugar epimerase